MTLPSPESLIPLIQTSYWVLFFLMLIEGPLVTMVAGAAVAAGYLDGPLVFLVVVLGDTLADTLYYALGRWGREGLITRWGKYFGITVHGVNKLEKRFENHGTRLLVIGKLSHGIGGAFLVAAGLARMQFLKYLLANTAVTIPKSIVFVLIGYYFGQAITRTNQALQYIAIAVIVLAVMSIFGYFVSKRARKEGI